MSAPVTKCWPLWGPNSGGGENLWFKDGQLWHHAYGDASQEAGESWWAEDIAFFVAQRQGHVHYDVVCAWLRDNGLL